MKGNARRWLVLTKLDLGRFWAESVEGYVTVAITSDERMRASRENWDTVIVLLTGMTDTEQIGIQSTLLAFAQRQRRLMVYLDPAEPGAVEIAAKLRDERIGVIDYTSPVRCVQSATAGFMAAYEHHAQQRCSEFIAAASDIIGQPASAPEDLRAVERETEDNPFLTADEKRQLAILLAKRKAQDAHLSRDPRRIREQEATTNALALLIGDQEAMEFIHGLNPLAVGAVSD